MYDYDREIDVDVRSSPLGSLTVAEVEGGGLRLDGVAAVYDTLSADLGGFRELISPGAFADSLAGDVRALWQHETGQVLGRTTNGTLRLADSADGLSVAIWPPGTTWARDAMVQVKRGDVDGMSFGFRVPAGGDVWTESESGVIRRVDRAELIEVSVVTFPAYDQTSITVQQRFRSLRARGSGVATAARARGLGGYRIRLLELGRGLGPRRR